MGKCKLEIVGLELKCFLEIPLSIVRLSREISNSWRNILSEKLISIFGTFVLPFYVTKLY